MIRLKRIAFAACLLLGCPASAGNLLGGGSSIESFVGTWSPSNPDDSPIARVVVSEAGPNHVRILVLAHCQAADCNWGDAVGRNHSGDPASDEIRSIVAEYDVAGTKRRLTLRQGPGASLRYELVTDFTRGADGHDYETSGALIPVAPQPPAPVAAASEPAAVAAVAPAPTSVVAAAPAASAIQEDCVPINLADLFVAPVDRGWQLRDYNHPILDFGSDRLAALKAQAVLSYYRFDEQCFIARPHAAMLYWRSAGEVPRAPMPHEDCIDVNPSAVTASEEGGSWKVKDGEASLLDFGDDRDGALLAVSVIKTYRLTRQCFAARPSTVMQYWLAAPG